MTTPVPELVCQSFNRYNKVTLMDNIALLLMPYKEDQDIVVLRINKR